MTAPGNDRDGVAHGRITLDMLGVATLLALVWLFISLLPLPPNDLWWHMAAGRTMAQEGAWITTNRWSYALPYDAPYVYQSWLSELVMYGAWVLAGVPGLHLLRTLAVVGAYAIVAWAAWRAAEGSGRAVVLALLMAVLAGWDNWTLRPQTLALLPGASLIAALSEYVAGRAGRRALIAPPLAMLLWVNLHGSFILGLALVWLAWLGAAAEAARGAPRDRLRDLTAAAGLTTLAALFHPLGLGIFGYVRDMLGNAELQQGFVEWQPPTLTLDPLNPAFWAAAMLLLAAALLLAGPRRPRLAAVLWLAALAYLASDAIRYIIWFALAAAPVLAGQLAGRLPARGSPAPRPVAIGHLGVLALLMALTLPWREPGRIFAGGDVPGFSAASGPYQVLLAAQTPVGAAEWLAANPVAGRFWTDMSASSYTIWRMPEQQVMADLRVELFPRAVWEEYFAVAAGDEGSLAAIERWQITHLLLDRGYNAPLIERLAATPGWCERYQDRTHVVFAACDAPAP